MSNMSYCRFENTLHDLQECSNALDDMSIHSENEVRKAKELIALCHEISTMFPLSTYLDDIYQTCPDCGEKYNTDGSCGCEDK